MGGQTKTTPKAYPVRITAAALKNIDEITGFIAFVKKQPLNAAKVGDDLFHTIDKIALAPFAYKECEEIPTKTKIYRRAICHSWSVIYRIHSNEIVVLGVVHHSRRSSNWRKLRKIK
jgi:plasmid stabilization system protein ParE